MNKDNKGVKYPRILAKNETTSRRQIEQYLPFGDDIDEGDTKGIEELKKALYSLNTSYAYIFDGLCNLCMNYADREWKDKKDETHKFIERADNQTETHFYTLLPIEAVKLIFCGEFQEYWPEVYKEIIEMASTPQPKKWLVLDKKHSIKTEPIRISLIREDGSGIKRLKNLSPRRSDKEKAEGKDRKVTDSPNKIVGITIEYFKPLFSPIIEINKRKTAGRAYIRTPLFFQLKINKAEDSLLQSIESTLFTNIENINARTDMPETDKAQLIKKLTDYHQIDMPAAIKAASMLDKRKFYLALANADNHSGDYITIKDLVKFIEGLWPRLIDTTPAGEKRLYPVRWETALLTMKACLAFYHEMTRCHYMDGGQVMPLSLILDDSQTGEKFGREMNKLQIQCLKSNSLHSKFDLIDNAKELVEIANAFEARRLDPPKRTGQKGLKKKGNWAKRIDGLGKKD